MENAEIIYDLCPGKFIWILKSLIISGKQYFWTTIQKGVPFNSKHILLENACPKLILAGTTISRKKNGGPDLICENNFKGKTISEMKKMIPSKCTWQKINNWLTTISRKKKRRAWFDLKKKNGGLDPLSWLAMKNGLVMGYTQLQTTFMACHDKIFFMAPPGKDMDSQGTWSLLVTRS